MLNLKEYAFVLDTNRQQLDPTRANNAWRLVRQKKAKLILKLKYELDIIKNEKQKEEYEFMLNFKG